MFDDKFIDNLPEDSAEAGKAICEKFFEFDSEFGEFEEIDHHDEYVEAYATLEAFLEASDIYFEVIDLSNDQQNNIELIRYFFKSFDELFKKTSLENAKNITLARARDKFKIKFGAIFAYQFSDGDLSRIQTLINEIREHIVESELFDAKHKEMILNRLEGLQKELHKKMSSLDKLWGLIGDAGVVLGKFGNDAKPLVDRIREIAMITWRTQARAEELPSATPLPLLSHKPSETKEPE